MLQTQEEPLEEEGVSQNDLQALISGTKHESMASDDAQSVSEEPEVLGKWVCAQSSQTKSKNHNSHITDKLEQLAKVYTHTGDKWRALSYSKAVNALKSYRKPISSYEVSEKAARKHASNTGLLFIVGFIAKWQEYNCKTDNKSQCLAKKIQMCKAG